MKIIDDAKFWLILGSLGYSRSLEVLSFVWFGFGKAVIEMFVKLSKMKIGKMADLLIHGKINLLRLSYVNVLVA